MMKTIFLKELRENAKWIAVGLAIMLALTWAGAPKSIFNYQSSLRPYLGFAGALFAILLGIAQSVWDYSDRQQGFLLHRNVSKRQVLLAKLFAGAVIYAIVVGIPLMITALYFAVMGPLYLPVRSLQIAGPAMLVALCYFFHPITIFMIIRSARWYGTKLLPLVLPVVACFFFYAVHDNRWQSWIVFTVLILVLSVLSLGMFFQPPERFGLVLNSLTTIAVATGLLSALLASTWTGPSYNAPVRIMGMDDDGTIWEVRYRQQFDYLKKRYAREFVSGSPILPGQPINLDGKIPTGLRLNSLNLLPPMVPSTKNYGEINRSAGVGDISIFWDERGYFSVYDAIKTQRLIGTITRDGFSPGSEPKGKRFVSNPFVDFGSNLRNVGNTDQNSNGLYPSCLVANREGVYLLNQATGDLQTVIDKPITAIASVTYGESISDGFLIKTESELERYQLQLTTPPNDVGTPSDSSVSQSIAFTKIATYPKLPDAVNYWSIGTSPNGKLAAIGIDASGQYNLATLTSPQQTQWSIQPVERLVQETQSEKYLFITTCVFGSLPVALTSTVAAIVIVDVAFRDGMSPIANFWSAKESQQLVYIYLAALVITTLVAMAWTYYAIRKRCTDKRTIMMWLGLSLPLGLAAPLAVAAIYPRLFFEQCSKCDRPRRVDRNKCEHCGAGWEPSQAQGIEILEGDRLATPASPR
jgi:hypothetical protein